jgi:hypothetical protein
MFKVSSEGRLTSLSVVGTARYGPDGMMDYDPGGPMMRMGFDDNSLKILTFKAVDPNSSRMSQRSR